MIEIGVKIFSMTNQRGQAAIFVALMFNVLFVFFAMAINVALVVHDKINLQNSADMAVYYAASKQAEMLTAMAHVNYQIRQSYKLLAWRYRVLGQMGLDRDVTRHPMWSGATDDVIYGPGSIAPSVCMTYTPIWEEVQKENLCNRVNLKIPPLPRVAQLAGFLGFNLFIDALSERLRSQYDTGCDGLVAQNWWFALSILHAFRLDQRNRKQLILALANNLTRSSPDGDFTDLDGNSVLQGARETFIKNLTYANKESFDSGGGQFQMLNSMAGTDVRRWLVDVRIAPTLLYTTASTAGGCDTSPVSITQRPDRPGSLDLFRSPPPRGYGGTDLEPWAIDRFLVDSDYQFTIGFEKNPWYMFYMGVVASTSPRQIFFPFGSGGIRMVARAFAKPFGGRMGPWYQSKWERSGSMSEGDQTDKLMSPRIKSDGFGAAESNDPRRLPNYSRFPGDELGLMSRLALAATVGLDKISASFQSYRNIKADFSAGAANDILPWDQQRNAAPDIRNMEIAAIAPDLFDITYYSIEPNYYKNYFEKIRHARSKIGIPDNVILRPDLGFSPVKEDFSIQDQMALVREKGIQRPEAYYFVRNKTHLLTSWLPAPGAFNYNVAEAMVNFGKCALPDDNLKFRAPGSCAAGGGRTGYSVKLVSRDALLSSKHEIGGRGSAPGPILNPPTAAGLPGSSGWFTEEGE